MSFAIAFLSQHRVAFAALGVALVLIGIVLFSRRNGVTLKAKSGGVVLIGDHNRVKTSTKRGSSTDTAIAITSAIVTTIGVMVAVLAWWYPKTP